MKKLIVGNWKMNPQSVKEAETIFKNISLAVKNEKNVEIVICPPFPYLSPLRQLQSKIKNRKVILGVQNVSYEISGAFTGEVSASMASDFGVKYAIVGHSERRAMGDTDSIVNKKINILLKTKITPILCVGESIRGEDSSYLTTVKEQLHSCLRGISNIQMKKIIIAYEPVWALSSTFNRHDATPHDFEEMKIYIRKILTDLYNRSTASSIDIIYGGSVNKDNALSFLEASACGLLPGKASLDAKNFSSIIKIASKVK